eukprot:CAMPEP_0198275892 /NCGR_PEP_ID=MMETSP1447-20131203/65019_1 /TAXON_ID=420782 /ORGANISM="Chaetoceros dichaeta, Strain CCMP1751" /LENGTH=572 /DNA_ID=CAMNT_0043970799 /DNA_START=83 /DNA_END=1801 /DNA_ORIENTATION=+
MVVFTSGAVALLVGVLINYADAALVSNSKGSPQVLSDSSGVCTGYGRTSECEVQLDVPSQCVSNGQSTCPVVFYLHGAGGSITGFKNGSDVHTYDFIGVYPKGENGWNTGPKDTNQCEYTEFECTTDPDEGDFIASIISEVRSLGANGGIYVIGNSNGAALAHRLAVNAGEQLPVKGIVTTVTQLLASPERSGPGTLNYNNHGATGGTGLKVSVLNIMGTGDNLIPYAGGSSGVFGGNDNFQLMPALESMADWASHNGCSSVYSSETVNTDNKAGGDGSGEFYQWENCGGGTIVEHYAINGAGHSAGNTEVDGVAITYDISADFIKRCEDTESPPTVSPKPQSPVPPTPVPPTKAPVTPTKAPSIVGCFDDPNWVGKFNDLHDCDFVGEMPEARCGWENSDGELASEACKLSCDNCGSPPTVSPVPPTNVPVLPTNAPVLPTNAPVLPTKAPSLDVCSPGEALFLVELMADTKSKKQNMYLIQKKNNNGAAKKWSKIEKKNKFTNSELHTHETCLPTSDCHRFRIKDKKKNGLCCDHGEGWYKIYYDGKKLNHKPFNSAYTKKWQTKKFGSC